MQIFDSHCHLNDPAFQQDLAAVVERARQAGVTAMMVVGGDEQGSRYGVTIAHRYAGLIAAVGVHPHDVRTCDAALLARLQTLAADQAVHAWGEIGLDFFRMLSPQKDQEHWFERQLAIADELRLPLIFHERDSRGRFLEILKSHWRPDRQGVVHCFSGSAAELEEYLALGLHIGITGIVTHQSRGAALRRMVGRIPADRLLVETDAPYLTPTPERNKHRRNEPAFVRSVLHALAAAREETPTALAAAVWSNTCRLYHFDPPRAATVQQ